MDKFTGMRIGTLVNRDMDSPAYIREILPHGFESFSLTFWQNTDGIDWNRLADETNAVLDGTDSIISSLAVFGNPLETGEEEKKTLRSWEEAIDNASQFGCDIVAGFTGRVRGKPIHESAKRFQEVWKPLMERAEEKGIRVAFENCSMAGTWQSGDWNIAHNPTAWELMFNLVESPNMGLEWEPCHQMFSLIDPMPQIAKWGHRMFHIHGKDATICWDSVREYGVHSTVDEDIARESGLKPVPAFVNHSIPGFGDSDWTEIISELRKAGYSGSIDIEGWHDPIYKDELEMTGQVAALNYLKECRGGFFVPNPKC